MTGPKTTAPHDPTITLVSQLPNGMSIVRREISIRQVGRHWYLEAWDCEQRTRPTLYHCESCEGWIEGRPELLPWYSLGDAHPIWPWLYVCRRCGVMVGTIDTR